MKKITSAFLFLSLIVSVTLMAQPGGGFPGGRPGGRPGGERPEGGFPRSERFDRNMQDSQKKGQTVKQKKVRSGSTFKVVGTLIDSTKNEPLGFGNVAVLDKEDSSLVRGAATDLYGYFEVTEVPAGEYLLRATYIGYTTRYIPFKVENNTALGNINMKEGSMLKAVTVKGQRPLYAQDGEKMIYNVADDPSIQTGTTNDALQNAPGVEVDVEGNVTLRGVSSVEIWINDKPSKLTEENLKTYLETLPANALDRIEAITNPSAKYATDAEAVINIITSAHVKSNQFVSFGVNGSTQPNISPWISYMWAKEKLSINVFASGRYSFRNNKSNGWSITRVDGSEPDTYDTTRYQTDTSSNWSKNLGGNLFMNINYEIDSMSDIEIHGGVNGTFNRSVSDNSVYRTVFETDTNYTYGYSTYDSTRNPGFFGDLGADYTKKFDLNGHNLRIGLSGRFSHNRSTEFYDRMYTEYYDLNDEYRYRLTNQRNGGGSLYARYNRPYSKDGEMSYGLNADYTYTHNSYDRYYRVDSSYNNMKVISDLLRTYDYNGYTSNVSGDVNWTHRWGNFTLSTGIGLGLQSISWNYNTEMDFADNGERTFITARPSVHLSYRTESMHNFKLNYSMRMRQPDESQLTKFRIYGDESYRTGNPDGLKPSYTHSAEAGWTKYFTSFGNVGIEGYGRLATNEISSLTDATNHDEYLFDRMVSYSIPYNMGSSWRYGASLNMTYRPTGFFNVRLYANLYDYGYHMEYDHTDDFGNVRHQDITKDKWSWSVRVNAWAKVWDNYQIHLSAHYNSPTIGLLSETKARYSMNMGIRSDFFKRKLSVFINIQDLFNWGGRYGTGSTNTNPYYLSESTRKTLNSRFISAGITLRFGKMELERQAKVGGEGDDSE